MDPSNSVMVSPEEIGRLSTREQKELQQWVQSESQKAGIQSTVHELTEKCFNKCITGAISDGKLAGKEESCVRNCVERFMDSNLAVLKHLETLRAQQ